MEQFNANPIRSGVGLTVTPPQTASRSITPTESHKPDPRNLIITLTAYYNINAELMLIHYFICRIIYILFGADALRL